MAKLRQVCRHIRSKNAGPFWITLDLFFDGPGNYTRYRDCAALGGDQIGALYDVASSAVKRIAVDRLHVLKISYPRPHAQGWGGERDMHGGQLFTRLLDVELD